MPQWTRSNLRWNSPKSSRALSSRTSCLALFQLLTDARTLVFRADSLPLDSFADGFVKTPETLALADGEYTADVALSGGTGKATVTSPAKLIVSGGTVTAVIEWSSSNYDYMIVGGEKYLTVNETGNSVFEIPVSVFDFGMAVRADTTAMSTPHEIDYTLFFRSDSIAPAQ